MLQPVTFIKSVHTVIFLMLNAVLVGLLYEVIADKITALTRVAVILFVVEGIILMINGWKCPLSGYA